MNLGPVTLDPEASPKPEVDLRDGVEFKSWEDECRRHRTCRADAIHAPDTGGGPEARERSWRAPAVIAREQVEAADARVAELQCRLSPAGLDKDEDCKDSPVPHQTPAELERELRRAEYDANEARAARRELEDLARTNRVPADWMRGR